MKKGILFFGMSALTTVLFAQQVMNTVPLGTSGNTVPTTKTQPLEPQDGNASLGAMYDFSKCGLDYTQASVKLGQRYSISCCPSTPGVVQPAAFAISGIPGNAVIEKAFLWAGTSGGGIPVTATIVNPLLVSTNFLMPVVGQDQDKCWSFPGTFTYRADVTSCITGNGNYMISGLPTSTNQSGNDTDGATLMIIYSIPGSTFQGEIHIWDGCWVGIGNNSALNLNSFNACDASTVGSGFIVSADHQQINSSFVINGGPPFQIGLQEDWYNYITVPTSVIANQSSSNFQIQSSGDCYNWMVAGLYFQTTNCTTCCIPTGNITVATTSTTSNCNPCSGTATANPSGGNPPYSYFWNSTPPQSTQTATGLCPGTYTVAVQDTSCNTGTLTVTITAVNPVSLTATSTNLSCFGAGDGTAQCTPVGGTAPFTYSWSTTPPQTTQNITGLNAGTYTVTITDAAGCTATATVTITQPGQLLGTANFLTNVNCNGGNNGSASVNPAGGNPPYAYLWSPTSQTTQNATGLSAGIYTVVITDASGCSVTATCSLTQPAALSAPATATPDTCGQNTGTVSVNVTGGTAPYAYSWTPGNGTGPTMNNVPSGTYTVTITDGFGCTMTATATVTALGGPSSIFTVTPTTGSSTIPFDVSDNSTAGSGTIVTWIWNYLGDTVIYGQNPPPHTYSTPGIHCIRLTVISNLGCRDSSELCIEIIDTISVPNVITPNGDGINDALEFKNLHQYPGSRIVIYNRWGNILYEDDNYLNNWIAKDISDGTYYFVLYVADAKKTIKAGWVAVMRGK